MPTMSRFVKLLPETLATQSQRGAAATSRTGFKVGDVLLYIRDSKILSVDQAERYLLEQVEWGKPVSVKVLARPAPAV